MKQFLVSSLLLLVVPMVFLNPMGREAFLGYYLGVIAMWAVVAGAGIWQAARAPRVR